MVIVKLSAEDERLLKKAQSLQELEGVRALVLDRIERARVLASFGRKEKQTNHENKYNWKQALDDARSILGEVNVTVPPFPESYYYKRCNTVISRFGINREYMHKLAKYVQDHGMRIPISFQFMLWSHKQILDGEYDGKPGLKGAQTRGWEGRRAGGMSGGTGGIDPLADKLPEA